MTSETEIESAERGIEPPGARLRAAREAAGLGQHDVAMELRLGVDTIDALEHDAVDKLPAPIFVRGYLRNYAVLVGLPAQELVDAYNGSVGRGQSQGLMAGPMQQQLVGARRRNYLAWLLVLVAAVTAGWWFQQRTARPPETPPVTDQAPPTTATQPPADSAAPALPETMQPSGLEPQAGVGDATTDGRDLPPQAEPVTPPPDDVVPAEEEPAAQPVQAPAAAPPAEVTQQPTAATGDTLTLAFSDRSWVEVRDAAGERLLYRLANAGETRTLQGKAPFRLVLGNAPAVRVELNGTPVDVASHTSGRTARFSIAP